MIIRQLETTDFEATYDAMRRFTATREATTPDELWLTEHHPVYTAGAAGRPEVGAEVRLSLKAGALPAVFAA